MSWPSPDEVHLAKLWREPEWCAALQPYEVERWFKKIEHTLKRDLKQGRRILPRYDQLFRAFDCTPFSKVRVVIVGQDPYPNPQHACGLSFSVPLGVKPLPQSLSNIFKEYAADLNQPPPASGDLYPWTQKGVLLLNTVLSVRAGQTASHQGIGWEEFTRCALKVLGARKRRMVFFLWGRHARAFRTLVGAQHLVLEAPHPSPLSAHRGFFGHKPFSKAKQFIAQKYHAHF